MRRRIKICTCLGHKHSRQKDKCKGKQTTPKGLRIARRFVWLKQSQQKGDEIYG